MDITIKFQNQFGHKCETTLTPEELLELTEQALPDDPSYIGGAYLIAHLCGVTAAQYVGKNDQMGIHNTLSPPHDRWDSGTKAERLAALRKQYGLEPEIEPVECKKCGQVGEAGRSVAGGRYFCHCRGSGACDARAYGDTEAEAVAVWNEINVKTAEEKPLPPVGSCIAMTPPGINVTPQALRDMGCEAAAKWVGTLTWDGGVPSVGELRPHDIEATLRHGESPPCVEGLIKVLRAILNGLPEVVQRKVYARTLEHAWLCRISEPK